MSLCFAVRVSLCTISHLCNICLTRNGSLELCIYEVCVPHSKSYADGKYAHRPLQTLGVCIRSSGFRDWSCPTSNFTSSEPSTLLAQRASSLLYIDSQTCIVFLRTNRRRDTLLGTPSRQSALTLIRTSEPLAYDRRIRMRLILDSEHRRSVK
ncbi:hypothetical protein K466DRAFT_126263 [Polyporus arcularius HHB13444]|uniref:Uncharacterized protein n=1 Tax=Polyporus arcularius HHB13444 TaxID=1314778 RepID=A0A5C3PDN7_9APHY|nr:hypothetical protein K466DRAFT_126263 [Polyporus arcularius HHB13444]